jgi:hypothetical protein
MGNVLDLRVFDLHFFQFTCSFSYNIVKDPSCLVPGGVLHLCRPEEEYISKILITNIGILVLNSNSLVTYLSKHLLSGYNI